jgi:hypothetical protein
MKIAEYKQMMEYLTRPGFNGGGSVRNKTVLPKKKPEEEVKKRKIKNFEKAKPALENPKEVKEMIDKPKRGLVDEPGKYAGKSAAERQREYRERNPYKLKTTDIVVDGVKYTIPNNAMKPESAKGFIKFLNKLEKNPTLDNYRDLVAGLDKKNKNVGDQIRNYRYYLQGEKKGAFIGRDGKETGVAMKKLFDEIKSKLPPKSTNLLSKITSKDIKGQVVKTATKVAGEIAKSASMDVVNAVRDIFVKDVNNAPSLDDIAEGLEGSPKWNAASDAEKIKMRTSASNATKQFLEAVTGDRKVKGFKDIAPETLGDIVQYIDDNKRGEFRFAEGLIRDYKIKLRDSLIKGDFGKQRRNISGQKGKVIDEVFGLSATYENAPGYTENIQIISDNVNKLKRTQIDKPFAAILKAVKEGRDTVTFDKKRNIPISEAIKKFNLKSKVFSKVNKVSSPLITVGDNLDATKLVSNFNKYSPQAKQNIKQLAKDGFVLTTTKPSTPVGTFSNVPVASMFGAGQKTPSFGKAGQLTKTLAKGESILAPLFVYGGSTYGLPFKRSLYEATYGIAGDSKSDVLKRFQPKASTSLDFNDAQQKYDTLLNNYNNASPYDKLRFKDKMAEKTKEFQNLKNQYESLPLPERIQSEAAAGEAETQYENLLKANRERRFQYGVIPKKELFMDIKDYFGNIGKNVSQNVQPAENVLGTTVPMSTITGQTQYDFAGGGIAKLAGKSSGPAPESGPTPQGLDFLMKRGR